METAVELYEKQVRVLPVTERLHLMQLIMDDLAESAPRWVVESSDEWSAEDLLDAGRASLLYAAPMVEDDNAATRGHRNS